MRQRHDFSVTAYVVMPEHFHQLVSEPRARLLARRFRRLSLNQSSTYAYDGFNRLTGTSTGGSPAYSFVYDRWGNRLQQNALQGGTTSVLNINTANNQVTGTGSAPNSFTYDAAGNLTSDGAYTYTYDPDGNVLTVGTSSGTVTTTYTYDALNRRVRIQAARGAFEFAFDANGRRVSTWNAPSGSLSETLIYWGSQPVAFHTPPGGGFTHFQYQDWMGTERLRTSGSVATVEGTYQSLPYGDGYSASGNDYDWYHFAGQDFDPESSTQHAQFRQYASVQGRWMSPDPYDGSYDAGNPQSLNRYSYALNSPLGLRDPLGLDTSTCVDYFDVSLGRMVSVCDVVADPDDSPGCTPLINPQGQYEGCVGQTPQLTGNPGANGASQGSSVAPNTVPYMYIHGIGMIGPSPAQGCDYVAKVGNAALHAVASGFGNLKGTATKLMSGLKFAAPTIGVYTEAGATALGVGETAAAGLGATVSGAAEAVGGLSAVYAVGSGIVDFYNS